MNGLVQKTYGSCLIFRGLIAVGLILFFLSTGIWAIQTSVSFPSTDGILIRADYYTIIPYKENRPLIILFHQAGWSRGEYLETAPVLNEMGFHCLAVDLRSGSEVNDTINETAQEAKKAGKKTNYSDAWVDLEASVAFARTELKPSRLILWGSSYSASLALRFAGLNPRLVDAVIAFSPGEYFSREAKEKDWIGSAAKGIRVPVWITSAGDEQHMWKPIYDGIPAGHKFFFLPQSTGQHGSRALWSRYPGSQDYWKELRVFLDRLMKK